MFQSYRNWWEEINLEKGERGGWNKYCTVQMSRKMTMACPYLRSDYKPVPRRLFLLTIETFQGATYLQFLISYFQASDTIYIWKWENRKQNHHTSFNSPPPYISRMQNGAHTCPHSYKLSFKLVFTNYRSPTCYELHLYP